MRTCGILLHISSLPSKYGIGTLGIEAYRFIDFLESSHQSIWQILPLGPTGYGDSPYSSLSSRGLNYYFISFDTLRAKGLLKLEDYKYMKKLNNPKRVDYGILFNEKMKILRKAFNNFDKNNPEFIRFFNDMEYHDFALFMALKANNEYKPWYLFKDDEKSYSYELEEKILTLYKEDYLFYLWTQFEFLSEWNNLVKYAHKKNIKIMGDIPLYLSYDSVEVWKNPELFKLDKNKNMAFVAGCPPDGYNPNGQLWGNPVYNWEYMKQDNYIWWKDRIKYLFKLFDYLRLDHFRGFDRYYEIKAGSENAKNGTWEDGPKFELFKDILDYNIVVEDLGVLDDGVYKLLEEVKYPGMKILQEAFDGNKDNIHKPSNTTENYIVYTVSHDGMPTHQMFLDLPDDRKKVFIEELNKERKLFNLKEKEVTSDNVTKLLIELAYAGKSNYVILSTQDILNQLGDSRMNLPGEVSNSNWSYRILPNELNIFVARYLKKLALRFER